MTWNSQKNKGRWDELEDFYESNLNYMQTIGFGKIDWIGVKSVLLHTLWVAALSAVVYLFVLATGHNWGTAQPIMVTVFAFVGAFLKKLCEKYQVPFPTS